MPGSPHAPNGKNSGMHHYDEYRRPQERHGDFDNSHDASRLGDHMPIRPAGPKPAFKPTKGAYHEKH